MRSTKKMKNFVSRNSETNSIVGIENRESFINISYNKRETFFMNSVEFIKFIKTVETMIRKSKEYKSYIAYLKEDIGLKQCSVFGNVNDSMATIEMHHGPIFTLYDCVEITLSHLFRKKEPINSSNVAHHVLRDHFDNLIQVVMLSESAHNAVHKYKGDVKFFIPIDSAWGDISSFITKYSDSITVAHIQKLKMYLKQYEMYSAKDEKDLNHIQVFKEFITSFNLK